jgi:hypothetical protein
MNFASPIDTEQSFSGIAYSPPPITPDRLAHVLVRYAALLTANAFESEWVKSVALKADDFPLPAPQGLEVRPEKDPELEQIFNDLVKNWKEATGGYSVTTRRYAHPSYHAILLLKEDVVPLILQELQQRPDWWFEALKLLTKENPVKPGSTFEEAVNAWIDWGKRNKRIL